MGSSPCLAQKTSLAPLVRLNLSNIAHVEGSLQVQSPAAGVRSVLGQWLRASAGRSSVRRSARPHQLPPAGFPTAAQSGSERAVWPWLAACGPGPLPTNSGCLSSPWFETAHLGRSWTLCLPRRFGPALFVVAGLWGARLWRDGCLLARSSFR